MHSIISCIITLMLLIPRHDQSSSKYSYPDLSALEGKHSLDYIMGKFDPASHHEFTIIEKKYCDKTKRYLRKDAYKSFVSMAQAAKKEGIKLTIISATRNFENQKNIWEKKWTGQTLLEDNTKATAIKDVVARARKILLYSSMPGTSRHHWGTDIDLNNLTNEYFAKGKGKKMYDWMQKHAHEYGYCQVYNSKSIRLQGYNEEKWHWSYMPVSDEIMNEVKLKLHNDMIKGFQGAETVSTIDMVQNYIQSINQDCH